MKTKTLFLLTSAALSFAACQNKQTTAKVNPYEGLPTFQNTGNPLIKNAYSADPATLVVGDRLYLFTGHDECFEDSVGYEGHYGFNITNWLLYSTEDMQTWTDHGVIFRPTDFTWGVGEAWAAQCVEKDGKFYYYLTAQAGEPYTGKAIGVAVSDSPAGPYKDAIGRPLIDDKMTDNGERGWWNDIDPTVLIDNNGTPWLCWGNGTCFMAKLKDNMIELADSIKTINLPRYVEGPWLSENNGIYYLVYVSMGQGRETISYAMAKSMVGPWEPKGEIAGMADNSFTIHPAICKFKGKWYFFYHNGNLELNGYKGAGGRRSVCVEEMFFNEDGTIQFVEQTLQGICIADQQ